MTCNCLSSSFVALFLCLRVVWHSQRFTPWLLKVFFLPNNFGAEKKTSFHQRSDDLWENIQRHLIPNSRIRAWGYSFHLVSVGINIQVSMYMQLSGRHVIWYKTYENKWSKMVIQCSNSILSNWLICNSFNKINLWILLPN